MALARRGGDVYEMVVDKISYIQELSLQPPFMLNSTSTESVSSRGDLPLAEPGMLSFCRGAHVALSDREHFPLFDTDI